MLQPLGGLSADDVWMSLVVQIAVIGGAAAGRRLLGPAMRADLLPRRLLGLAGGEALLAHVHGVLRGAGVRFVGDRAPAAKARAIAALLAHPRVMAGARCRFGAEVLAAARDAGSEVALRRTLLAWTVPGFGPKSVSDWLNNHGLSRDLIAFDARVCGVLAACAGPAFAQERVARLAAYEAAEAVCRRRLATPLGCGLAEIDKRLFVLAALRRTPAWRSD